MEKIKQAETGQDPTGTLWTASNDSIDFDAYKDFRSRHEEFAALAEVSRNKRGRVNVHAVTLGCAPAPSKRRRKQRTYVAVELPASAYVPVETELRLQRFFDEKFPVG